MTPTLSEKSEFTVRPLQYRDLEAVEKLLAAVNTSDTQQRCLAFRHSLEPNQAETAPWKLLSLFPGQLQHLCRAYVAEQDQKIVGLLQASPFNATRSTWRVDQIIADPAAGEQHLGTQLLRACFEAVWEARTWLVEVNVQDSSTLGLYRQNGFQHLANLTYWQIPAEALASLASRTPDLPNLLPITNADAALLYQLDTAAMPPLVRQVFDRHVNDFRHNPLHLLLNGLRGWFEQTKWLSGYVFEPQRKAAIGYYGLRLSADNKQSHMAQMTVHPAYTWLYPELLAQMAQLLQTSPAAGLQLVSTDYQPEREACLEQLGAERIEHGLMMSRSVWHKVRESRSLSLENLQLAEMLQGFQQNRKPVPGRLAPTPQIQSSEPAAPIDLQPPHPPLMS